MAAKIKWHGYGTELCHCHPLYRECVSESSYGTYVVGNFSFQQFDVNLFAAAFRLQVVDKLHRLAVTRTQIAIYVVYRMFNTSLVTAKKTNACVLNKAGVKRELLDTVEARKLAYYGHTMRKQKSCLEKEIMQGTVPQYNSFFSSPRERETALEKID